MGRLFRWISHRRENSVEVRPEIIVEPKRLVFGDLLKVLALAAAGVWGVAAAASKLETHDRSIQDHESRLRVVERLEPQVQAMYAVIVEGKRPRGVNPDQSRP